VIERDEYEEILALGASPDLIPGSWAAVRSGRPANGTMQPSLSTNTQPTAPTVMPNTYYSYNYIDCKNYALAHCDSYNPAFCSHECDGADCANFVSQCLNAGGEWSDSSWNCSTASCVPCGGTSLAGTYAWVNNVGLTNWLRSTGRGSAKASIDDIGTGDVINYDWTGGGFDHVALITGLDLVSCHTMDLCNVDWQLGGAAAYLFTWINATYWM
jgi:hypothetical protein